MYVQETTFKCEYDGEDVVTVYDGSLPPGWVMINRGGNFQYYHNGLHASYGNSLSGGVFIGRSVVHRFTDDHDGTVVTNTTGALPSGWEVTHWNGITYHFKSQANQNAWLALR